MLLTKDQILNCIEALPTSARKKLNFQFQEESTRLATSPGVANFIDHTLLKAEASAKDIEQLCEEAKTYHFFSVCVPPYYISLAKKCLKDSGVKVCSVIGFPLGSQSNSSKTFECRNALEMGADEIDFVINIGALKSQKFDYVFQEIETLKQICGTKVLKCIIETALLTPEEIIQASFLCRAAGADFVKTSTGFSTRGASLEDIELISTITQGSTKIKASGGIRSLEDAKKLLAAGANRLGCSSGVQILAKQNVEQGAY